LTLIQASTSAKHAANRAMVPAANEAGELMYN